MNKMIALIKREFLDGKNGYLYTPAILAALTVALVVISAAGFGGVIQIPDMEVHDIHNFGDALGRAAQEHRAEEELPAAITMGYWSMSLLSWVAFPFVVFFSLLGSLYEERRDRSILFWKSMPVADWQEVIAKLVTPVLIAPVIFLGVAIAAQLIIAMVLTVLVLFQGGPVGELWPVGLMITSWFAWVGDYVMFVLWALPLFAWVLLVSSYANRMPFLWAILPPLVLMAIEEILFNTNTLAQWIGTHIGGWQVAVYEKFSDDFEGPKDFVRLLFGGHQMEALSYTFTSVNMWLGLAIAAGLLYAATEMRKRAI